MFKQIKLSRIDYRGHQKIFTTLLTYNDHKMSRTVLFELIIVNIPKY